MEKLEVEEIVDQSRVLQEQKEQIIKLLSLNQYISADTIEQTFDTFTYRSFAKDEVICKKGESINQLFLVLHGRIGMYKSVYNRDIDSKEEILVQEFESGSVIGLKELTHGMMSQQEQYKYVSISSCEVAQMDRHVFNTHYKSSFDSMQKDIVLFLKQVPLLNCISFNKLQQYSYYITLCQVQRGQTIYSADEQQTHFYLLMKGSLACYQKLKKRPTVFSSFSQIQLDEDSQQMNINGDNSPTRVSKFNDRMQKIREYHEGQYFGEVEIIQKIQRQFTIISESTSIILRFTPYLFSKLIKEDEECWNYLQNQVQFKEKIHKERNDLFQASLKIVKEGNDQIHNQQSVLKAAQQRVMSQRIQKQYLKLSQQSLQTDDSVTITSKQENQQTISPNSHRSYHQNKQYQKSLNSQNSLSCLNDQQYSSTTTLQNSPPLRTQMRKCSVNPQNLNIIIENDTFIPQQKLSKQSLAEIDDFQQIDISIIKGDKQSPSSKINKPTSQHKLSLSQLNLIGNNNNLIQNNNNNREQQLNNNVNVGRQRHSSMINISQLTVNNSSKANIQDKQGYTQLFERQVNQQKGIQQRYHQNERIGSQDYIDKNTFQLSSAIFNESCIENVSDMFKQKMSIGAKLFRTPIQGGDYIDDQIQTITNNTSRRNDMNIFSSETKVNQQLGKVTIIDKHTENFAKNLKNVFYRVLNKKNISKQDTQKGLENQVLDEGLRKYVKIHSSIQLKNREFDYLKQQRLKYNDQLANVIYGRVKNYIEKKNDDEQFTPRLITYKTPSSCDLFSVSEQADNSIQTNEKKFKLSPAQTMAKRISTQANHDSMIQQLSDEKEDTTTYITSTLPNNQDRKIFSRLSLSPIPKHQANISQQVFPLGVAYCISERLPHCSLSPQNKALQSRNCLFRNDKLIPSLNTNPSTISLLKRHQYNSSLKQKFSLLNQQTPQKGSTTNLRVASVNNFQPTIPEIQTARYSKIKNY